MKKSTVCPKAVRRSWRAGDDVRGIFHDHSESLLQRLAQKQESYFQSKRVVKLSGKNDARKSKVGAVSRLAGTMRVRMDEAGDLQGAGPLHSEPMNR